jgi:hypothetical protein
VDDRARALCRDYIALLAPADALVMAPHRFTMFTVFIQNHEQGEHGLSSSHGRHVLTMFTMVIQEHEHGGHGVCRATGDTMALAGLAAFMLFPVRGVARRIGEKRTPACGERILCPIIHLLYGDTLDFLRDHWRLPSNSVDLVYLDPPSTPTPITT